MPVAVAVAEGRARPVTFEDDCASDSPSDDAADGCSGGGPRRPGRTRSSAAVSWLSSSSDSGDTRMHEAGQAAVLEDGEYDVTETGLHAIASCIALLVAAPNGDKGGWLGQLVCSAGTAARSIPAVQANACSSRIRVLPMHSCAEHMFWPVPSCVEPLWCLRCVARSVCRDKIAVPDRNQQCAARAKSLCMHGQPRCRYSTASSQQPSLPPTSYSARPSAACGRTPTLAAAARLRLPGLGCRPCPLHPGRRRPSTAPPPQSQAAIQSRDLMRKLQMERQKR